MPFAIRQSGAPGRPIVISAYPGERVRITQPQGWQREHVHEGTIVVAGARHFWIHGFEVEGCLGQPEAPANDTYGQNGITLAGGAGEGVRLLNNIVSRAQHCGIKEMGHGGKHFLVEGNVVLDCGALDQRDHGLYIPASEAVVRGNAVFGSKGFGLHLYFSGAIGCALSRGLARFGPARRAALAVWIPMAGAVFGLLLCAFGAQASVPSEGPPRTEVRP